LRHTFKRGMKKLRYSVPPDDLIGSKSAPECAKQHLNFFFCGWPTWMSRSGNLCCRSSYPVYAIKQTWSN